MYLDSAEFRSKWPDVVVPGRDHPVRSMLLSVWASGASGALVSTVLPGLEHVATYVTCKAFALSGE